MVAFLVVAEANLYPAVASAVAVADSSDIVARDGDKVAAEAAVTTAK